MGNWKYIPEIRANVDLDDIPEHMIGHPALQSCDVIADLDAAKANNDTDSMMRNLNIIMAML